MENEQLLWDRLLGRCLVVPVALSGADLVQAADKTFKDSFDVKKAEIVLGWNEPLFHPVYQGILGPQIDR
jgi:hypothetical protein